MNVTIVGTIAALVVGGALSAGSVLTMVNGQVNGGSQQTDINRPVIPYGASE